MIFCSVRTWLGIGLSVIVILTLLPGCSSVPMKLEPPVAATTAAWIHPPPHLVDSKAQARLAFSQFRLFGAQDRWDDALAALQRARAADPDSVYLQLLLARVYLHMERPAPAIALLTRLLDSAPDQLDAHLLLGDVFILQQQNLQALHHFHRALELTPDDEVLHLRLAMVFLQLDRVDDALATLERLLQKQPDAYQAILSLARIYRDNDQPDAAERVYRHYLERLPGQQQVTLELGRLLEDQDPESALKLYLETIDSDPYAAAIRQQLAQFYLARRQPEDALRQMLIIRQQSPRLQEGGQIGLVYLHLQQWVQAEKEFQALLSAGHESAQYRYYLALALIGQQRHDDAIAQLEQILPGADMYPDAMLQLAFLYQQQGDPDRAFALLDAVLAQGHQEPEIYYYQIAFLQESDKSPQALEIALAATALYPEEVRLLYQLAVLHDHMDQHQSALEVMETILLVDDQHADALNFLAYSQAQSETDLALALERAHRALQLKPAGYIEDTVGWVYFKLGLYPESREHLERANRLQPDDPIILEHLADLFSAMKLYEDAAAVYQRVLELDPEADTALDKLRQLRERGRL